MLPSQAGRSGKCQYVSFTDSAPYFTRTFLVRRSPGSEFVRGERDGGLYDITGGPHEGTSRHDLYARYISHACFRTTKTGMFSRRRCHKERAMRKRRAPTRNRPNRQLLVTSNDTPNTSILPHKLYRGRK